MLRCVAVALAIAAAPAVPTALAAPAGPPLSTWVPNGEVKAVAVTGQMAYVGGNFSRVAPYTGGSVRIDPAAAAAKTPWPEVAGVVNAVASDGVGGWYLGGDFSSVGGVPRQNLAHVLADGTLDGPWGASVNGVVRALVLGNGTVFAGGTFTMANGEARDNIAGFTTGNGVLDGPNVGVTGTPAHFCSGPGFEDRVFTLAFADDTLYVGGIFDTAHGTTTVARNGLAAFTVPGGVVTGFNGDMKSGADLGPVYAVQPDAGGHVYVGGCFTKVNGGAVNRSGVARLQASTGANDGAWNPGTCCGSQVDTIALIGTRLYVAAFLPGFRDTIALNLVDGSADAAWDPPMHDHTGSVTSISGLGSTIYLGGSFKSDDGTRIGLAAVDATTSAFTSWAPDGAGPVKVVAANGSDVVAGGGFETYGGVPRRDLAAIDLSTGMPTAFHAPISDQFAGFSSVDTVALGDGLVWAGGNFTTTGPPALSELAAFDATSGAQTSFDLTVNNEVHSLLASDPDVYVGGNFTQIGGTQRRGLALVRHVQGDQGEVQRFDADVQGDVSALARAGDQLYLGGEFDKVNTTGVGAARHSLAAVNATTGDVLPFDPNLEGPVNAVVTDGGNVFAGGEFAAVGGAAKFGLAKVDGTSGALLGFDPEPDRVISALALHGRTLFAGGDFASLGGNARPGIAAVDADSGAPVDLGRGLENDPVAARAANQPQQRPRVDALAVGPSTGLVAGGLFLLSSPALRAIDLTAFRLPPTSPTGVSAAAGDASATVSFGAPAGDGGSAVTSYTVVSSPAGGSVSGGGSPLVVNGLEVGTSYTFTVRATNGVGEGPPSAPSNAVTPTVSVHSEPTDPRPLLLGFTASPKRFRAGARPKRGTVLRLRLSEAAKVRFIVLAKKPGRKVAGRCRKPTRKNRKRKHCSRLVRKRTISRTLAVGAVRTPFTGRFGKRKLAPGRYLLRATPADLLTGLEGNTRSVAVTIIR